MFPDDDVYALVAFIISKRKMYKKFQTDNQVFWVFQIFNHKKVLLCRYEEINLVI